MSVLFRSISSFFTDSSKGQADARETSKDREEKEARAKCERAEAAYQRALPWARQQRTEEQKEGALPQKSGWVLIPEEESHFTSSANLPVFPVDWQNPFVDDTPSEWTLLSDEESYSASEDSAPAISAEWESPHDNAAADARQSRAHFLTVFKRALEFKRDVEAGNPDWNACWGIGLKFSESLNRLLENDPQGYEALRRRVGWNTMPLITSECCPQRSSFLWAIDNFRGFLNCYDDQALLDRVRTIINGQTEWMLLPNEESHFNSSGNLPVLPADWENPFVGE